MCSEKQEREAERQAMAASAWLYISLERGTGSAKFCYLSSETGILIHLKTERDVLQYPQACALWPSMGSASFTGHRLRVGASPLSLQG
jgi:hypothetical protein